MGSQLLSAAAANAAGTQAPTSTAPLAGKTVKEHVPMANAIRPPHPPLEAQPGSPAVLMAEVRYGIVFGEVNELFYGKLHRALLFVTILCGLLTGAGLLSQLKLVADHDHVLWLTIGLGVLSAIAFSARTAFRFDKREEAFREARKQFQDLEGKGWSMAQGTLDKEIKKIRKNAPAGGGWLASYAYNKACKELGHPDYQMRVPRLVRFVANRVAA